MTRLFKTSVRSLGAFFILVLLALSFAGCQFTVAGKSMRVLVTTRIPGRTVEHGEVEKIRMEPLEAEGNTFFIVVRSSNGKAGKMSSLTPKKTFKLFN